MTDPSVFEAVDEYIDGLFDSEHAVLSSARARARAAGLPDIEVSAGQGRFLYLMAKLVSASRILEVGTLGGYSTIWLARALDQGGTLTTLELEASYAAIARQSLDEAQLPATVDILVGDAAATLTNLDGPYDLVFLDANKDAYPVYLQHSKRLLRPGGVLLADNVIRGGAAMSPHKDDPSAVGAALFNRNLAEDPAFEAVILQQVGVKGHDGIAVARRC